MTFRGDEFAWGPDKFDDWVNKVDYLVQLGTDLNDQELLDRIKMYCMKLV